MVPGPEEPALINVPRTEDGPLVWLPAAFPAR